MSAAVLTRSWRAPDACACLRCKSVWSNEAETGLTRDTVARAGEGGEGQMRTLPRRRGRLVAKIGILALIATACLGGSNNGNNPAPGASVSPIIPTEPTKPVTITFSSWVGDSPQMKQFAADFHSLHPNITIEFQAVSADNSTTKLTTQVAGGTAPDVAFMDASAVTTFASRGALVNLDGYIAGSNPSVNLSDFVPGFLQTGQYQGSTYGLPLDGETTGLFYRKDMFQAAGIASPPTTWEEFQTDAQQLTDPANKQYGFIEFAPESEY